MKGRVRQLRVELKSIKKCNNSIVEFVLCVKAIENLLLALGDMVSIQDYIEFFLNGLYEEVNPIVLMKTKVYFRRKIKEEKDGIKVPNLYKFLDFNGIGS